MSKKDKIEKFELEGFDFGFTSVDAEELDEVQDLKKKLESENRAAGKEASKASELFNAIMPLLDNLASEKKDYIHWPHEIRIKKINEFKEKLENILGY